MSREPTSDFRLSTLRIAFMGTAAFAVPALRALAVGPERLVGVFTPPDRPAGRGSPAGRGRALRAPAVKLAAQELGLPVYQPDRVSRGEGFEQFRRLQPDLVVVAAFGEIIAEEALVVPRLGAINIHASLLPRWRGAAPIQRAIMAGERVTGVSVQWMARQMDAGDLILQRQVEIREDEDFGSLHDRLAAIAASGAVEAVELIRRGEAPRLPQDHSQATSAPPITTEDLTIDWSRPADELARLIRALSPQPGARTTRSDFSTGSGPPRANRMGGDMLKVISARAAKKGVGEGGIPGQVMESGSDGFLVVTGDGCLLVLRVQPAGRKVMSAADYVKGYRLRREERLGL